MSERVGRSLVALSDPTRRRIVEELVRGSLRAGELAERPDVSVAALTRHLRVLRLGDMVNVTLDPTDNRRHMDELSPEPIIEIRQWIDDLAGYWQKQLRAIGR